MKKCIEKVGRKTAIGAVLLLSGIGMLWQGRKRQLQHEIDEFDLIMQELKADRMRHYNYYE